MDRAFLAGPAVEAADVAAVAAGVGHLGVARLRRDVSALAAGHVVPVAVADAEAAGAARDRDGGVILLRAVDAVGELVVGDHVVELRGRLVLDARPAEAAVERDRGPAVVSLHHPARVLRGDPEVVVVPVRHADRLERLPPVLRPEQLHVEDVDGVGLLRVGRHVRVVPGPLPELPVFVRPLPGRARVVGAEDPALLGLDHRVDALRSGGGDGDADPAPRALRQALPVELPPLVAAVRRLVEPAPGAAALQAPRRPLRLPEGGVEDARVGRVHREVHGARLVVHEERLRPGLPAVPRAEDAALGIRAPGVAEGGHVHVVGVLRVDADAADLHRVAQAHVAPRLARVRRAIDAVAVGDVAADAALAHAGVEDVRVGRRHREGADRTRLHLAVGDRRPLDAGVRRLPDPAPGRPHVVDERLAGHAGHGRDAAAPEGTDRAPAEALEERVGEGGLRRVGRGLCLLGGDARAPGGGEGEQGGGQGAGAEGAGHGGLRVVGMKRRRDVTPGARRRIRGPGDRAAAFRP